MYIKSFWRTKGGVQRTHRTRLAYGPAMYVTANVVTPRDYCHKQSSKLKKWNWKDAGKERGQYSYLPSGEGASTCSQHEHIRWVWVEEQRVTPIEACGLGKIFEYTRRRAPGVVICWSNNSFCLWLCCCFDLLLPVLQSEYFKQQQCIYKKQATIP